MGDIKAPDEWLLAEIAEAEAECRRMAKRDGIPDWWIETILAKLRASPFREPESGDG